MQKLKTKEFVITCILAIALIFFLVIVICQIYESNSITSDNDRIVLGVNTAANSTFGTAVKGQPVPIGDCVGLVSGGSFTVVDKNAEIKTTESFMLTDPIVHSKGRYCVAADFGGQTVKLYEEGEVVTEIKADGDVLSVVTNANGFFAVATEQNGYNAVIVVYQKNGTPIYKYSITDNTFVDMDISANNRKIIVVEANVVSGAVGSQVIIAEFKQSDAVNEFYVASNLYVGVHFNKNGSFVAIGSEGVDFYRADCTKTASVSFFGKTLIDADITTDDLVSLAFKGVGEGNVGSSTLEIYNKNGKLRASVGFEDEIEHISVNGSYVTASHGQVLDIVKSNGKIKKTITVSSPVKYGIAFKNGNAALVFAGGNTTIVK